MKSKLFVLNLLLSILFGVVTAARASTVTVNTNQDVLGGSECSLRAAIQTVNSGAQVDGCVPSDGTTPDTITLPADTYVLTISGTQEGNCDDGDLDVNANLTLNGAGSGTTTISASGLQPDTPERVFHLNAQGQTDITITLNGVTIRDGEDYSGGGIEIFGDNFNNLAFSALGKEGTFGSTVSVTLNDVVVTKNKAIYVGGGIENIGAGLTLNDSQVTGNQTQYYEGGGIAQEGVCLNCDFEKLLAVTGGGLLTLQNTTISGNDAGDAGGGVYNETELVMDSSTVSDNTSHTDGGGIFNQYGALALITNSTINDNHALGDVEPKVRFDMKLGIFAGDGLGGGIFQGSTGELVLVNSTVSHNDAFNSGGGIAVLVTSPTTLTAGPGATTDLGLFNVTITGNIATATVGGGVFVFQQQPATLKLAVLNFQSMVANTLIAGNSADEAGADCFGGPFTSLGYNLIGQADDTCTGFGGTGDQVGTPATPIDAKLGPLQNNGGPTATHALLQDSPAIDSANPDGCLDEDGLVLTRDQRNFTRPINATGKPTAICDIGAFEVGNSNLKVVKTDSTGGKTVGLGNQFTYTITITNEGPDLAPDVQLSDPLPVQVDFVGPIATSQGTCSESDNTINCDLDGVPVGTTVTVSFPVAAVAPSNTVVNTVTVTSNSKDFGQPQTYTATVTTAVGSPLFEGSGCGLQLVPGSASAPLAMVWPVAVALGYGVWMRVRRHRR